MRLVVGLGNPGREYAHTRHNVGFMVIDELARRWKLGAWKTKLGGEIAQQGELVVLKPQEYMNVSGQAVSRTAQFFKIPMPETIVVHDEIDLPFGRLKVKLGGGHAGHNGLRSITESCGAEFIRVRCGVGKPDGKERTVGHVLGGFSKEAEKELPFLVGEA